MDQSGETILRLRSENAELRAELERWKQGEDVELRQLKLQNDEFRKLLKQWMEASNLVQDIFVPIYKRTEFSLSTEKRSDEKGVFCLDHRKVMTNGICPTCAQQ